MSYSWDSRLESYPDFLRRRSILDEQTSGLREIRDGLSRQTMDLIGSAEQVADALSGDIGALAAGLESGLGHVAGILDDGFAGVLRKSDEIKRELQRLVELVELEEQRKAMENFRYAAFALNRGLWDEALEYVVAAIEGDAHSKGYKLDWHFHWLKGELLLGSPARCDWPGVDTAKAEQSFLLAARYARADDPREAARSLLMASVAAFAQSHGAPEKLTDMLRHAEGAVALNATLGEAAFQVGKAHMALGAPTLGLPLLRKAVEQDITFVVRAGEDPDYSRHERDLNGFLEALRQERIAATAQVARAALRPFEARIRAHEHLAQAPSTTRLEKVARGDVQSWALLQLHQYAEKGLKADVADIGTTVRQLEAVEAAERLEQRVKARAAAEMAKIGAFAQYPKIRGEQAHRRLAAAAEGRFQEHWRGKALDEYEKGGLAADAAAIQGLIQVIQQDEERARKAEREAEELRVAWEAAKAIAAAELGRLAELIAKSKTLADFEAVQKLRKLAAGDKCGWNRTDVERFVREGASTLGGAMKIGDRSVKLSIDDQIADLRKPLGVRRESNTTTRHETVTVNEPVQVEEKYVETVVLRPGGLFRKPVTESVERTRTVSRVQSVTRVIERQEGGERIVVLDGFGDVLPVRHLQIVRIPAGRIEWVLPTTLLSRYGQDQHYKHSIAPFLLGDVPVTQALYRAVTGGNPSYFTGADRPVEGITAEEAFFFCNELSRLCGLEKAYNLRGRRGDGNLYASDWAGIAGGGFRLPTRVEWWHACRASSNSDANDGWETYGPSQEIAWYEGNSQGHTHDVGQKSPNRFGLHDMLGNVWERVMSYDEEEHKEKTSCATRYAGGSWACDRVGSGVIRDIGYGSLRVDAAARLANGAFLPYGRLGFRIARTLKAGE